MLGEKHIVKQPGGCWIWTGKQSKGYPMYGYKLAHRMIYQILVGPIPEGLELDHLCRVTLCVNPAHLEPVTRDENMRRRYQLQTHCVNGHPFDAKNTYLRGLNQQSHRGCRTCNKEAAARYRARKRERAA